MQSSRGLLNARLAYHDLVSLAPALARQISIEPEQWWRQGDANVDQLERTRVCTTGPTVAHLGRKSAKTEHANTPRPRRTDFRQRHNAGAA